MSEQMTDNEIMERAIDEGCAIIIDKCFTDSDGEELTPSEDLYNTDCDTFEYLKNMTKCCKRATRLCKMLKEATR